MKTQKDFFTVSISTTFLTKKFTVLTETMGTMVVPSECLDREASGIYTLTEIPPFTAIIGRLDEKVCRFSYPYLIV